MKAARDAELYAAGGAVVLALGVALWIKMQGAAKVANTTTRAAINVAGGVAAGVVEAAGGVVGIPETNADACQLALSEGRWLDASFACPAATFVKALVAPKPVSAAVPSAKSKSVITPAGDASPASGYNDYVGDLPTADEAASGYATPSLQLGDPMAEDRPMLL